MAISTIQKLSNRGKLPVHIWAKGGSVHLRSQNEVGCAEYKFAAESEEFSPVAVDSSLLCKLLTKKGSSYSFFFEKEEERLLLKNGTKRYSIQPMVSDLIQEPDISQMTRVFLDVHELKEFYPKLEFSISSDPTKHILQGISIRIKEGRARFASTDGHRLTFLQGHCSDSPEFEIVLPKEAFFHLEDPVELYVSSDRFLLRSGSYKFFGTPLYGVYPIYEQLIPHSFTRTMVLEEQKALMTFLREIISLSKRVRTVKLTLGGESLVVKAEEESFLSVEETFPYVYFGEPAVFTFNLDYLLEALKHFEGKFQMNEPNQPVIIGDNHLLMPVIVRK